MKLSVDTKQYCLVGDPVDHSLSPFIMNRAFAEHGLDAVYSAFCIDPDHFVDAVLALNSLGILGCNVTYPYKEAMMRLADRASTEAMTIYATNTLVISAEGIDALNTDAAGTVNALETFADIEVRGRSIVILGAGGSARAAAHGLLEAGADPVTFAVRDESKAEAPIDRLVRAFGDHTIALLDLSDTKAMANAMAHADIVINATPVGMPGHEGKPLLRADWIRSTQCCFDFVYHPRDTVFLRMAAEKGARVLDGISLLVAQAAESYHIWTARDFKLRPMYDAVTAHLARRSFTDRG